MSTENIDFTILGADSDIYTNSLTPISAVPWPNKFEELIFPTIPIDFSQDNVIWDFGDGTKYTGVSASHVYQWPGSYNITLTIIDELGTPVKSTTSYTISAIDMVPTQVEWSDTKNIVNIPSGKKTNPIQFSFKLSWQNYLMYNRESPLCEDGKQHWMNPNSSPGSWMCGDSHSGQVDPPIYTFNLYASGSNAPSLNVVDYAKDKLSHLKPFWTFYNTSSALSATPTDSISVTQIDAVTGTPGEHNTYELIYHAYNSSSGNYEQVTEDTPGAVFTGLSGTVSYYYYDSIPKCNTTRNSPVMLAAELDSSKLTFVDTFNKYNQAKYKSENIETLKRTDIKPRVNKPAKIAITSNGLNEFNINKNKWIYSDIQFTVTKQDIEGFNIIDNTEYDSLVLKLVDATTGTEVPVENYNISSVDVPEEDYYIGSLYCTATANSVQLSGAMTYTQLSGYNNDAIVAYTNLYRPAGADPEFGNVNRMFHQTTSNYNSENLTNQITDKITQVMSDIDTNGSISTVTLTDPGANLTGPPAVVLTDPTGTGASLACVYDETTQRVTEIKILNGGINYISPVVSFISNKGATSPAATVTTESNFQCKHFAVSLSTSTTTTRVWGIEAGPSPRLLEFDNKNKLLKTLELPPTPVDIKLDSEQNIWIVTTDKLLKYSTEDTTQVLSTNLTYTPTKLEVDLNDNILITTSDKIRKYNSSNNYSAEIATYTAASNITDILTLYDNNIYILVDNNTVEKISQNFATQSICNLTTPFGLWTNLTTSTDGNIYLTDSRSLYQIDTDTMTSNTMATLPGTPNVEYICGDSRGYIILLDNGSNIVYYIDAQTYDGTFASSEDVLEIGKSTFTSYPALPDGTTTGTSLRALGDFTGYHWLQKYGYVPTKSVTLTGTSDTFSLYSDKGMVNIVKYNEDFDSKNTLKSYAIQPWLNDQYKLWENIGTAVGDSQSSPETLGKLIYEKVSNFTANNNDIDDCNIECIHNYSMLYDIDIDVYNFNYPPSIKRLVDILSIKHKRLFGEFDGLTNTFDMYTDYTEQDIRENLGPRVDFDTHILTPGEVLVAYEKFSKIFTPISITYPTSGTIDQHDNIINVGMDRDLVSSETQSYPLSSYSPFWNWNLVAPNTVFGKTIVNYYDFYKYNDSSTIPQVEGVIKWSDSQTTLSPTLSTYDEWSKDTGLVDNILEHQLRTGLSMFNSCITYIDGSMECT